MAWVVPIAAPVIRFSWRIPEVDVIMIRRDVIEIAAVMPRRMPIIICLFRNLFI